MLNVKKSHQRKSAPLKGAVFTSLPKKMPRFIAGQECGETIQRACIESWQEMGLDIYSFNGQDEIEFLKPKNANVNFVVTGGENARPKISDMIALAQKKKFDFLIICNADCFLFDHHMLQKLLKNLKPNDLCILERLNLNSDDLKPTGISCAGFDMFIVGRDVFNNVPKNASWKIGDTWWDYWFPITVFQAGGRLSTISAPIIMHIDHIQNWNFEGWKENAILFAKSISEANTAQLSEKIRNSLLALSPIQSGHLQYSKLGDATFAWLRQQQPFEVSDEHKQSFGLKEKFFQANFGERQVHVEAHMTDPKQRRSKLKWLTLGLLG